MKKFLAVAWIAVLLLLEGAALAQTALSGSAVLSGGGQVGNLAGTLLTYNARTENCVTGAESGCIAQGGTGRPLTFLGQVGDPMPWYQTPGTPDPADTAITDPDFGSYQVLATAAGLCGFPVLKTYKITAGEWDPWSQDSELLVIGNNGGAFCVFYVDVARIHAQTCSVSNPCLTFTGIKTTPTTDPNCPDQSVSGTGCTTLNNLGEFSFSRTAGETHTLYELMGSQGGSSLTVINTQVNKLALSCCTSGSDPHSAYWSLSRTPVVNFTSNTPVACSVLPVGYASNSAWAGMFAMANDGSIGYTAGGAGDWAASTAYTTTGANAFIYPVAGGTNTGHNAFQVTAGGTSGASGSEPNWASCTTTCADGTVTWTNIGKPGGQGNGRDVVYYSPTRGCSRLNTFIGYIYRGTNEGASYPSAGTADVPEIADGQHGGAVQPLHADEHSRILPGALSCDFCRDRNTYRHKSDS